MNADRRWRARNSQNIRLGQANQGWGGGGTGPHPQWRIEVLLRGGARRFSRGRPGVCGGGGCKSKLFPRRYQLGMKTAFEPQRSGGTNALLILVGACASSGLELTGGLEGLNPPSSGLDPPSSGLDPPRFICFCNVFCA